MGASGSAWIKHKKRKGLRPDPLTGVAHPLFARPGQRYVPIMARAGTRVPMCVTRVVSEAWCEGRREDVARRPVRVRTARLLAADESGVGRYYRFIGYASRSRYSTHARVIDRGPTWTRIVCPEWHPELLITVATRVIPQDAAQGGWLACRADLGANGPGRVQPHDFLPVQETFDPTRYRPAEVALYPPEPAQAPELGPGCGDVVFFLSVPALREALATPGSIYLSGQPPEVSAGGRAYLHVDGRMQGWRTVRAARPLPNGTHVELEGPCHATDVPHPPSPPPAGIGIVGGVHRRQLWTWREWRRADESTPRG